MKNILFVCFTIICLILISNFMTSKNLIPKEAIRIRVIANSNEVEDQELKLEVKNEVEEYLYNQLKDIKDSNNADIVIKENIPNIEGIVNKYTSNYKVNYGINYFPKKEYKNIVYKEGDYKSLVITLGNGLGDNWWCVLFPPLCLMEGSENDDIEYHSYIADTVNKYIK